MSYAMGKSYVFLKFLIMIDKKSHKKKHSFFKADFCFKTSILNYNKASTFKSFFMVIF
jgi:hypothetical protein